MDSHGSELRTWKRKGLYHKSFKEDGNESD